MLHKTDTIFLVVLMTSVGTSVLAALQNSLLPKFVPFTSGCVHRRWQSKRHLGAVDAARNLCEAALQRLVSHSNEGVSRMAALEAVQQLERWSMRWISKSWRRGLVIRATTSQPVDTSKARVVAQSALSFQYQLRQKIRKVKEVLNDPQAKLEVTAADKDAYIAEMAALAKNSGLDVTEAWLRENIPIADSYKLGELERAMKTPVVK
jgi:hypothetical protein